MSGFINSQINTGNNHMVIKPSIQTEAQPYPANPQINTYASYIGRAMGGNNQPTFQKAISIDSQFRNNYYKTLSTDFTLTLPNKISNIVSMTITGFEMPNTYFQIAKNRGNNYFWLGWQKDPAPSLTIFWFYIGIPDGTYSSGSMENEINIQIQKATGLPGGECPQCSIIRSSTRTVFALPATANPNAFLQLAFNRTNGSYTITEAAQNNTSLAPIDKNVKITYEFGWILGFRLAEYKGATSYMSEGVFDTWGLKYAYIIIDDYNKNDVNSIEPIYNSSLGDNNIMGRIGLSPIESALGGTSLASMGGATPQTRNYFGPVDIEKLHIKITDKFGRVIDLNNMDCSLALTFTCLYNL